MTQLSLPEGDQSNGNNQWTKTDGVTTTNLYQEIDESSASDTDFVRDTSPVGDIYEVSISDVSDPGVNTGHTLHYRYEKSATGGMVVNLTVALVQGATPIASWTINDIPFAWTAADQGLSEAEANLITNYNNLRVRISGTNDAGSPGRQARVSWVQFEIPDVTPRLKNKSVVLGQALQRSQRW